MQQPSRRSAMQTKGQAVGGGGEVQMYKCMDVEPAMTLPDIWFACCILDLAS